MRRANRLSFMLRRGPALSLRTVLLARPPLTDAERAAVAARLAEELQARGSPYYESESEWEEMEGDDEADHDEQGEEYEATPADDEDAESTAADGSSPLVPAGDEDNSVPTEGEKGAPSSGGYSSGAAEDAEQEAGGEPGPLPAAAQPRESQILAMLRHLLLHTSENSCSLAALEESTDVTLNAVQELRQDMEARFAALEKSVFHLLKQIGAPEPLPTKRRIGYSCGPKGKGKAASLQAAASDSSAATASVAALALAMPAVSQAAAH